MHKNGLSLNIVLKLIKTKKGISSSQFYNEVGEFKVLISFNQLVKLLFSILHFCILGQTQKNDCHAFLAVEMKKSMMNEKNNQ